MIFEYIPSCCGVGFLLCGLCVVDTLNLDERGVGVGVSLSSLVAQMLSFHID